MAWEVIVGTDPRFAEFARGMEVRTDCLLRQIKEKSASEELDEGESLWSSLALTFSPQYHQRRWDRYLLLSSSACKHSICVGCNSPVKFLSTLNPVDADFVAALVAPTIIAPSRDETLDISYRVVPIFSGHCDLCDDLETAIFDLICLDDAGSCWNGNFTFYFDLPLDACYAWARRLEETLQALFPRATFGNRLGLCSKCGETLRLHEYNRGWWGPYLCDSCNTWKEAEEQFRDERSRERQKRKIRKRNLREGKRLILRCVVCTRKFERTAGAVKGVEYPCCGDVCTAYLQSTVIAERKRLYTPEFLRLLLEHEGDTCAFPGCLNPKALKSPSNPWNVCALHLQRIKSALYHQSRKREAVLSAEGIDPMKGDDTYE